MISLKHLLKEDPDGFEYDGKYYDWHKGFSTFSIVKNHITKKDIVVAIKYNYGGINDNEFLSTDKNLEKYINDNIPDILQDSVTHTELITSLNLLGVTSEKEYRGTIAGRSWKTESGIILTSFWNTQHEFNLYINLIKEYYKLIKEDITKSLFEFINLTETWLTYDQSVVKGIENLSKSTLTDKEIREKILKIQHLSPEVKKAMIKLPVNKKSVIANQLGFNSIAELDNLMKQGMDEGLSMSDYMSDEIPYDKKPTYSIPTR